MKEKAGKRRYQGGEKPPAVRKDGMLSNGQLAPGRAQNLLAGCIFVGVADKSAFALLSQKVTKEGLRPDTSRTTNVREGSMIVRRIRRSLPDREKGKFIEIFPNSRPPLPTSLLIVIIIFFLHFL